MQLDYDVTFSHDRVFEFNDCLYIFALQAIIIKMNILSHEVKYIFYEDVNTNVYLSKAVVRNENKVYILQNGVDDLLIFDLEKDRLEVKKIEFAHDLETMCIRNEEIWFTNNKGELILYELNTNKIERKKIDLGKELFGQIESFVKSFFFNESIWLIPQKIDYIIRYHITAKNFTRVVCPKDCQVLQRKNSYKYLSATIYKNFIFLLDCASEKMYRLNMLNFEIMPVEIEWDINILNHKFINEGDLGISLEKFIQSGINIMNN